MTKRTFKHTLDFGLVELVKMSVVKHGTEYIVYINRPVPAIDRAEVIAFMKGEIDRPDWVNATVMVKCNIPQGIIPTIETVHFTISDGSAGWSGKPYVPRTWDNSQRPFTGPGSPVDYNLDDMVQYGRED